MTLRGMLADIEGVVALHDRLLVVASLANGEAAFHPCWNAVTSCLGRWPHAIQNQLAFNRVLCCTLLPFVRVSRILPPLVESSKHFSLASRSCTLLLTAHHDPLYRKALTRHTGEFASNSLGDLPCIAQANSWTWHASVVLAKTGRINHSDQAFQGPGPSEGMPQWPRYLVAGWRDRELAK